MSIFSFFKSSSKKKQEEVYETLGRLIYDLLEILEDDKVTDKEKGELREIAYHILLELGYDDKDTVDRIKR